MNLEFKQHFISNCLSRCTYDINVNILGDFHKRLSLTLKSKLLRFKLIRDFYLPLLELSYSQTWVSRHPSGTGYQKLFDDLKNVGVTNMQKTKKSKSKNVNLLKRNHNARARHSQTV